MIQPSKHFDSCHTELFVNTNFNPQLPPKVMEKYNGEKCLQIMFTNEGLNALKEKYRNVNGLPGFLHNTMKGRPTDIRDLVFKNDNIYRWSSDKSILVIPSPNNDMKMLLEDPFSLKNNAGIGLVAWVVDSRLASKYGWKRESALSDKTSFKEFLISNEHDVTPSYKFFKRSKSQEKISELELNGVSYLATILDLSFQHVELLKIMRDTGLELLKNGYGVDLNKDIVEIYFHFPYEELTTTLHLHFRVNYLGLARHPLEKERAFTFQEVLKCLEDGRSINELILKRSPYYTHNSKLENLEIMLSNIQGVYTKEIKNPFFIS